MEMDSNKMKMEISSKWIYETWNWLFQTLNSPLGLFLKPMLTDCLASLTYQREVQQWWQRNIDIWYLYQNIKNQCVHAHATYINMTPNASYWFCAVDSFAFYLNSEGVRYDGSILNSNPAHQWNLGGFVWNCKKLCKLVLVKQCHKPLWLQRGQGLKPRMWIVYQIIILIKNGH